MGVNLDGYVSVADRLAAALERYPDLRIQEAPAVLQTWGNETVLLCTVTVWRDPADLLPAIASATEPFPGRTPYTRNSELMVGNTSALGRALGYMGFGSRESISSADEVERSRALAAAPDPSPPARSRPKPAETGESRPKPPATTGKDAPEPATPDQLARLEALGHPATGTMSSRAAGQMIAAIERGQQAAQQANP